MSDRYSWQDALAVVKADIAPLMQGRTSSWSVCGSLRRILDWQKRRADVPPPMSTVGDLDILYISTVGRAVAPGEMFAEDGQQLADAAIGQAVASGIFRPRTNKDGSACFGKWLKSVIHQRSGIQVDFKRCTPAAWFNLLVQFTGSARSNAAIASKAKGMGWTWTVGPQDAGFRNESGSLVPVRKEEDVFALVGLDYKYPAFRN